MKQMMKQRRGFTLIELMIVIAIISMLTVLGGANYITSQKRARDSRRMGDLEQVRAALEMYRTDNGDYPTATGANGSDRFKSLYTVLHADPVYLNKELIDPLNSGANKYEYWTNNITYQLCAELEVTISGTCSHGSGNYSVENP